MRLMIFNDSNFSRMVGEIAKRCGKYDEIYYLDDKSKAEDVLDYYNDFVLYLNDETYFYPAFEEADRRCEWLNKVMELGGNIATIIDPSAVVAASARVLPGCLIMNNAIVGNNTLLKSGTVIPPHEIISKDTVIEQDMCIQNIGHASHLSD